MVTLDDLPLEIHIKLLALEPSSNLKLTSKYWYSLYNDLFYHKMVADFGEAIIPVIIKVLPWLKVYIKSMDVFRRESRELLAQMMGLPDSDGPEVRDSGRVRFNPSSGSLQGIPEMGQSSASSPSGTSRNYNPLHCRYVKDSWRYIYSVLKNKRLFANQDDYNVDVADNYVYRHYVEVNQSYLLSYKKVLWLAPGKYNLNIALVVKHGSGLGTTKFQVRYLQNDGLTDQGELREQTFFPPLNIKDILPKNQFCVLKIGEFEIAPASTNKLSAGTARVQSPENKLVRVKFVMEESGLYLKSGFSIFFIDFQQQTSLFNQYDLLYYSVQETNYKYFVNLPLKNLYRAIEYVQLGYHGDQIDESSDEGPEDEDDNLQPLQMASQQPRRPSVRRISDAAIDTGRETREFTLAALHYGQGDPGLIPNEYDLGFLNDKEIDGDRAEIRKTTSHTRLLHSSWSSSSLNNSELASTNTPPPPMMSSSQELTGLGQDVRELLIKCRHSPGLMAYANFFFNNRYKNRYYKFNTVYQMRQFINRYGDFELDWNETGQGSKCTYDPQGMKWKIPILGDLSDKM
ncbi:hypothetical protein DICA1_E25334 [Diutina catenulata]